MMHGVFPLMELDVYPEDTLFFTFEEDWCLSEKHALLREMRNSPTWWPILANASTETMHWLWKCYTDEHDQVKPRDFDPTILWPKLMGATKAAGLKAYEEVGREAPQDALPRHARGCISSAPEVQRLGISIQR